MTVHEPERVPALAVGTGGGTRAGALLLVAIFAASLNLRAPLAVVPPLVPRIERELGLSGVAAGLITTLPVLCMGLFAPAAQRFAHRIGRELAVAWALAALVAGALLRLGGSEVWLLYAGTLVTGIGIAAAGTLLPGIVKQFYAGRVGAVTALYFLAMTLGATASAALAVPVADALGSWAGSLAVWGAAAVVGLLAWLPVVVRRAAPARGDGDLAADDDGPGRLPWRSGPAWWLTAFLAIQSVEFYSHLAWLAPYFEDRGRTPTQAGVLLSVFSAAQLVSGIGAPVLADRMHDRRPLLAVSGLASFGGLAGLLVAPDAGALWMVVSGLGLGAGFAVALVYLADWAETPAASARLTAMCFLVGYSVAAVGPALFGALRDASGGFRVPLVTLLVLMGVQLALVVPLRPGRTVH